RQSGKSELLRMLQRRLGGTSLTLDEPQHLRLARTDPVSHRAQAVGVPRRPGAVRRPVAVLAGRDRPAQFVRRLPPGPPAATIRRAVSVEQIRTRLDAPRDLPTAMHGWVS